MEDLFRVLGAGAKFKKRPAQHQQQPASSLRPTAPAKAAATSSSLDFFRSAGPAPASDMKEKKKRQRRASEGERDEDAGGGVTPPTSRPQQQAQQPLQEEEDTKKGKGKKNKRKKGQKGFEEADDSGAAASSVKLFKGQQAAAAAASEQQEEAGGATDERDVEGAGRSQAEEDEVRAFRKRMRIAVSGADPPACIGSFQEMVGEESVKRALLHNIEASKWAEPTPIQMQSVPTMAAGRDILASAPTGSGKTAAFVIPTLIRLRAPRKEHGPRALFLAPTRELAVQIHREVERLAQGKKFRVGLLSKALAATGKASGGKGALGHFDVMVATPMRLVGVLREGAVDLSLVEVVVLDEADKLFELGKEAADAADKSFLGQVDEILAACSHPKVQRALFSATLPPAVEELATTVLRDPVKVTVGTKNAGASTIEQRLVFVGREEGKLFAIRQLIREGLRPPVLVFLQSKDRARELFHELVYDGVRVDVLHAERTQEQRDTVVRRFRTGEIWVLICTDLIARGLDFKAVNMVINYDLPQSAVSYIHRIGRTGRAGRRGLAVTFFTEADMAHLRTIANVVKLSGCEVPEWMLSLKKERPKERRKMEVSTPKRRRISTVSGYDKQRSFKRKQARVASQQRREQGQGQQGGEWEEES